MPLINVRMLSETPPGTVTEIQVGSASYALCNVNGILYCVDGCCPHAGGPLAQGDLDGSLLVCPWHGWEFDCRTGSAEGKRASIATYPVVVREECILIDVPCQDSPEFQQPAILAQPAQQERQVKNE